MPLRPQLLGVYARSAVAIWPLARPRPGDSPSPTLPSLAFRRLGSRSHEVIMEQKNLLLAIVLSVAFMYFWFNFVVPRFGPPPVPSPAHSLAPVSETPQATPNPEVPPVRTEGSLPDI